MSALRFPWETVPAPEAPDPGPNPPTPALRPRGRRPALPASPDPAGWVPCALTVRGSAGGGSAGTDPVDALAAFVAAAQGPGITPWQEDEARLEEDAFHRALAVPAARRGLSVEACRLLARQYRDAVGAHRARAAAWGQTAAGRQACPLDLHALMPVPGAVLARGAADPASLAWCREHWGVVQIRRVALSRSADGVTYRFWGLGGTALRVAGLARLWPTLLFLPAAGGAS
ncbi:MAG TPA: hypothetical protein VL752_02395 [Acidisoma sp.]|uniref:hypothetical protein n=1 Tax=Acidisoma sp. TaxID=1872115 RepID=UPI002BC16D6A|nr:hypothetical protein [Acidisoma sp.]HTH99771.1 hypothetical protein [Acidisoma sp.]